VEAAQVLGGAIEEIGEDAHLVELDAPVAALVADYSK
jgi:hypothetical protein